MLRRDLLLRRDSLLLLLFWLHLRHMGAAVRNIMPQRRSSSPSNAELEGDVAGLPQYAHLQLKSMVANGTLRLPGFAVGALPRSGLVCRKVRSKGAFRPSRFFGNRPIGSSCPPLRFAGSQVSEIDCSKLTRFNATRRVGVRLTHCKNRL